MIFLIVNDFNEQQPLTYGNKFVKNNFTIIIFIEERYYLNSFDIYLYFIFIMNEI
jgi:hypothetical protein